MSVVATLVFIGTPATSLWPIDGLAASGAQLFQPRVNGQSVKDCGGMSPLTNACAVPLSARPCGDEGGCGPDVRGGLAYTGSITAYIFGQDRFGTQRYLSQSCSYIAGSSLSVGFVHGGGCQGSSNAPYECNEDPATNQMLCGNWMWPPFRLSGVATPPVSGSAPLSTWSVVVAR